jgi:hypothetical protein
LPNASVANLPFRELYATYLWGAPFKYESEDNAWGKAQCFAAYGLHAEQDAAGVACRKNDFRGAYDIVEFAGLRCEWGARQRAPTIGRARRCCRGLGM